MIPCVLNMNWFAVPPGPSLLQFVSVQPRVIHLNSNRHRTYASSEYACGLLLVVGTSLKYGRCDHV